VSPRFFETIGSASAFVAVASLTETRPLPAWFAVVNQAFVKKFFPNEDPIGRHFGTFEQKYAADYGNRRHRRRRQIH